MAFKLVQELKFDKMDYKYDRRGDVLDVSFGPPAPAIALQVEDWLAIQVRINPPLLQGMTIIGFKKIFEKINGYAEKELPGRLKRLTKVEMSITYDDESDTLVYRWEEVGFSPRRLLRKLFSPGKGIPTIFEPLSKGGAVALSATAAEQSLHNVYVEKALPSKDIVGLKILEFTKCGPAALEGIFGAIIDTIFEPPVEYDENVHLFTNALVQRFDWRKFAALAA
jgi:hypothetical protein